MRSVIIILGLVVLLTSEVAFGRPLDEENNVKEGDDAAVADKRDKIEETKKGEAAAKKDGPKTEKPTEAPATTNAVTPTKKPATTAAAVSTNPTSAPVTTAEKKTTIAASTSQPVKTTEAPKPEVDESDVENSANNTKSMNATTYHVAIRYTDEKYSDDLQITVNPVYEKTKQMVLTGVEKVYQDDPHFKQVVLIGFGDSENPVKENEKRATVKVAGVVADMYIRFHTFDTHLTKLSDVIKTGKLDNSAVSTKFVRAYTAEPKGRVCTPDCKIQCYSYCDQGCCTTIHAMVPIDMSSIQPAPAPAVAAPAPAPAPVPAPAPAPVYQPPAQPAPFPNYAPMPAPAALPTQCPPICNTYCAPQCPNQCCSTYQNRPAYPSATSYQQPSYPAAAPYPSYPAAMPATYAQQYRPAAQTGCGAAGCGK
eukprot:gene12724-14028_t